MKVADTTGLIGDADRLAEASPHRGDLRDQEGRWRHLARDGTRPGRGILTPSG